MDGATTDATQEASMNALPPNLSKWWAHQGSNLGPIDYESTALTN